MKTLRSISTAVLLSLIVAAPAAADSIHLTEVPAEVSSASLNVTYRVSGETEVGNSSVIRLMHVGWEGSNCGQVPQEKGKIINWHNIQPTSIGSFSLETGYDYEGLGTYVVCAVTVKSTYDKALAESSASFTVVEVTKAEATKKAEEVAAAKAKSEAEEAAAAKKQTEEAAVAKNLAEAAKKAQEEKANAPVKPASKPLSKLAKALKQCKKQKNKKKRAKCERAAKKVRH